MPFPKGGKHSDETKAKIRDGALKVHSDRRRDKLVRTGEGRVRAPSPTRERAAFVPLASPESKE